MHNDAFIVFVLWTLFVRLPYLSEKRFHSSDNRQKEKKRKKKWQSKIGDERKGWKQSEKCGRSNACRSNWKTDDETLPAIDVNINKWITIPRTTLYKGIDYYYNGEKKNSKTDNFWVRVNMIILNTQPLPFYSSFFFISFRIFFLFVVVYVCCAVWKKKYYFFFFTFPSPFKLI